MSKLANISGMINRLISRLTAAKGTVLAVTITLALIAGAGVGFASLRGSAPTKSVADSAPTATAPGATTPTLAATATRAPGATATPHPHTPPIPSRTVASGPPQLSVIPISDIQEPKNGCGTTGISALPNYFQNGFTVKNAGGGTLTWQISVSTELANAGIEFSTMGGSLAAGRSQYVQMYSHGGKFVPPTGTYSFTITSNGGPDWQMRITCN